MSQSGSLNNGRKLFQNAMQVIRGPEVDLLTVGDTPIFTFPSDFVLMGYMVIVTSVTGVPDTGSTSNLGWTAPNYDDVTSGINGAALPDTLGFEWGYGVPQNLGNFHIIPAGETLTWRVTNPDGGASVYTMRVDVWGYYYTGPSSGGGGNLSLTLTGDSGIPAQPVAGNWDIIGGTGVNTASSAGQLIINAPAIGVTWTDVIGTSQAMSANAGYTANNAGLVTLSLPGTCSYGNTIDICGKGTGGWSIAQNAGQTIHFNSTSTTTGAGGSLASTVQYNTVKLLCTVQDTDFTVIASEGNLTVV